MTTLRLHVGQCPLCRQGRLFLFRSVENGQVYAHCEECEQGYRSPDELQYECGFPTLADDGAADWASEDDVGSSVWAGYKVQTATF